jgi:hypothetical protein
MITLHPALQDFNGKLVPPKLCQGYEIPVVPNEKPYKTFERIAEANGLGSVLPMIAWGCASYLIVPLRTNHPTSKPEHDGNQKLHEAFGRGELPKWYIDPDCPYWTNWG